jgi:hypothetical protein
VHWPIACFQAIQNGALLKFGVVKLLLAQAANRQGREVDTLETRSELDAPVDEASAKAHAAAR